MNEEEQNPSSLSLDTAKTPLIYKKMGDAMREIQASGKNGWNDIHKYNFRGIDDLYNACHDALANNGIFTTQKVLDHKVTKRENRNSKTIYHHQITLEVRFWAEDGSCITNEILSEAEDYTDKGLFKAYSGGMKYTFIQVFLVPTGDILDPDASDPELPKQDVKSKATPLRGERYRGSSKANDNKASTENRNTEVKLPDVSNVSPTTVICHVGKYKDTPMSEVPMNYLWYLSSNWKGKGTEADALVKALSIKLYREGESRRNTQCDDGKTESQSTVFDNKNNENDDIPF